MGGFWGEGWEAVERTRKGVRKRNLGDNWGEREARTSSTPVLRSSLISCTIAASPFPLGKRVSRLPCPFQRFLYYYPAPQHIFRTAS